MTEDLTDSIAALRSQLEAANHRLIQAELRIHAVRAGIVDMDGLKLLDTTSLKLDENGIVTDADAAIANLKREKPWLFNKPATSQTTSYPASAPKAEPTKTRMAKDMTYEEWQAARARLLRNI